MSQLHRTSTFLHHHQTLTSRIRTFLGATLRAYIRWNERQAAKHHLEMLDDRMLKDIGISRSQIDSAVSTGRRLYVCR